MKSAIFNIILSVFVTAFAFTGCSLYKVPFHLPAIILPAGNLEEAPEAATEKEISQDFRLETYPDDPAELKKFIEELNDNVDITASEFEERRKEIRRLREFNPKQDPEIYSYILDTIRSRFLKDAILNAVQQDVEAEIEKSSIPTPEPPPVTTTTSSVSQPKPEAPAPEQQPQPQPETAQTCPPHPPVNSNVASNHNTPTDIQHTVPANYHANEQIPFVQQYPNNQHNYSQGQYKQIQYQDPNYPDQNSNSNFGQQPYLTQNGYSTTRGGTNQSNFTNAAYNSRQMADPDDPEANIQSAIDALSTKISLGKGDTNDEAKLRLLYLCMGNQREAVRLIPQMDESVRDFWSNQMLGLSTLIDDQAVRDPEVRYESAFEHLQTGMEKLSVMRPMKIRNMQFVKDLRKFGDFIPIEGSFLPGEKIIVYFELENLTLKPTPGIGYGIRGIWSLEVRNSNGTIIFKQDNNPFEERLQSKVRDYCSWIDFPLGKSTPQGIDKTIAPGVYYVTVTVRDLNHPKQQEARDQIEFRVITRE